MSRRSLSNCHPLEKDDINNGGIASLDLLNSKLRSVTCFMQQTVDNASKIDHAEFLSIMSDVLNLQWDACILCGRIEPSQIAADFEKLLEQPSLAK